MTELYKILNKKGALPEIENSSIVRLVRTTNDNQVLGLDPTEYNDLFISQLFIGSAKPEPIIKNQLGQAAIFNESKQVWLKHRD